MLFLDRTLSQLDGWWMFTQQSGQGFGPRPSWHSLQISRDHDGVLLLQRFADGRKAETRIALDGSTRYALMPSPDGHLAVGQRHAAGDRTRQRLVWTETSEGEWTRDVTLTLTAAAELVLEINHNGSREQVHFKKGAHKPLGWRFWPTLSRLRPLRVKHA